MTKQQDKISKEFYKRRYSQLSDEEKFDVRSAVKDVKQLIKRNL